MYPVSPLLGGGMLEVSEASGDWLAGRARASVRVRSGVKRAAGALAERDVFSRADRAERGRLAFGKSR